MKKTLLIVLTFAAACARAQGAGPAPSLGEMGAEPGENAATPAQAAPSSQVPVAQTEKRKMTPEEAKVWELPPTDSPELEWWRKSMTTREQRLAWWRDARFGMFVHWGPSAHLGGLWKGKKYAPYTEHIQRMAKMSMKEYGEACVSKFNPTKFDAELWVRAAKEAGMGYFIVTAKHHDGFSMYDSKVSDYNIVKATPFRRDPMKDLRDACAKEGVKFGFYYSHAFDWGEANAPGNDWEYKNPGGDRNLYDADHDQRWWVHNPAFLKKAQQYVNEKAIPQLQELIANYNPDILWFDTPHKLPPAENLRILKAVRLAKPDIVINGRLVRGMGDYANTADRPAEFTPRDGDWEGLPTTNEAYGYSAVDHSHKPPSFFIRLLAKAVARGGNVLMNIGPMGTGEIDPADGRILDAMASWWKVNGESIRGCDRTPLSVQAWGESTRNGNTLYLHVFDWPKDGKLVVGGLKSGIKTATLLADRSLPPLKTERLNPRDVLIQLPPVAPDAIDSVVKIVCEGEPSTDAATPLLSTRQTNLLRSFDGQIQGGLGFAGGKLKEYYAQGWTNPEATLTWPIRLNEPARFEVSITYMAEPKSAGGLFALTCGDQKLTGTVKSGSRVTESLEKISLPAGPGELQLKAVEIKGGELFRPFSITLTPETN